MFYVKLDKTGKAIAYPYTLTDLKRDNKHISFPSIIDEEVSAQFNVYPVIPTESPNVDHTKNLMRTAVKNKKGQWIETWYTEDATKQQIEERTQGQISQIISKRNQLLVASDWTQIPDVPVNQEAWKKYRQELRDLSKQTGFPWDVTWPEKP